MQCHAHQPPARPALTPAWLQPPPPLSSAEPLVDAERCSTCRRYSEGPRQQMNIPSDVRSRWLLWGKTKQSQRRAGLGPGHRRQRWGFLRRQQLSRELNGYICTCTHTDTNPRIHTMFIKCLKHPKYYTYGWKLHWHVWKDRRPAGGMINPKSRKVVIYGGRWGTEGWGAVTQQTYPRYHS